MRTRLFILILLASLSTGFAERWPAWRGPTGIGISTETNLPTKWDRETNIKWKVPLPEPGNSTPIVWDDKIFITQAVGDRRTVMCFAADDGKLLWQEGPTYKEEEVSHKTNPRCSASPVTDGERVIANFSSAGLYCYDMEGKQRWHRDFGKQEHIWGYGSSPVIYKDLCFLNFGPGERTFLVAVDKKTGKTVWQHDEPGGAFGKDKKWIGSWSTPVLMPWKGKMQLLMTWPGRLCAYDPDSGEELWTCSGLNNLVYTSPVYSEDGIILALGGFSGKAMAVRAGGQGDVTETHRIWHKPKTRQRIGSAVIYKDHYYILTDPGIAECFELKTGKLVWEQRLKGQSARGKAWSSMVLAGDKLYAMNQSGETFVLRASPEFELLSFNLLQDASNASPAPLRGGLVLRLFKQLWFIADGQSE